MSLRVYLATTAPDLGPHRSAALQALRALGDRGIALVTAEPGLAIAELTRRASASDVAVVIVGHRYGRVPEPGRGSYTEREAKAAREVLAFTVAWYHAWHAPTEKKRLKAAAHPHMALLAIESMQRLPKLKKWLKSLPRAKTFTTPEDLAAKVTAAVLARATAGPLPEVAAPPVSVAPGGERAARRTKPAPLDPAPSRPPRDPALLDRYERAIEEARLAGREEEAFDLFWRAMYGWGNLGIHLAEYGRVHRILAPFSATGRPEDLGPSLQPDKRIGLASHLRSAAAHLGRLAEADRIGRFEVDLCRAHAESPAHALAGLAAIALAAGRLVEARSLAEEGEVAAGDDKVALSLSLSAMAMATHRLGDVDTAAGLFARSAQANGRPLYSEEGLWEAIHDLERGDVFSATDDVEFVERLSTRNGWAADEPGVAALWARLDLHWGADPTQHIERILAITARTSAMNWILAAHLLAGRLLRREGDLHGARAEVEAGLARALEHGYGLAEQDCSIELSRIALAAKDPGTAEAHAERALDLARRPACGYALGQAEAAEALGEARAARGDVAGAREPLSIAQDLRRRIEDRSEE